MEAELWAGFHFDSPHLWSDKKMFAVSQNNVVDIMILIGECYSGHFRFVLLGSVNSGFKRDPFMYSFIHSLTHSLIHYLFIHKSHLPVLSLLDFLKCGVFWFLAKWKIDTKINLQRIHP
jgi:hypothetical protein